MQYQRISVAPIDGAMGGEISGVDLSQDLDNQVFDEIHWAFLQYQVIVFRDQTLDPQQTKSFAQRFGTLVAFPFAQGLPDHPEIFEIRKEPDDAANFGGAWHTDMSYTDRPPVGTMLYALETPPKGGDTALTNLYLAYDTLSDGMKELLAGRRGHYSAALKYRKGGRAGLMNASGFKVANLEQAEMAADHPLVRTHPESGRKALYISGSHLVRFADMTDEESAAMLAYLKTHAVKPDFICRVKYLPGTLVLWDNRCTQHYALNDYPGERRVMHRLTIGGGDHPS